MADRQRMSWRLVAVCATLAALIAVVVAVGHGASPADVHEGGDVVVATPRATATAVTAFAERLERLVPAGTVTTLSVEVIIVAMALAGLIGPTRRRIGDVGDRWRRLLLGAPPAAV